MNKSVKDKIIWRTCQKAEGLTVRRFRKFGVDQSPRSGDERLTQRLITCEYITTLVRSNTEVLGSSSIYYLGDSIITPLLSRV